jgi:hypothetical protein
MAGRSIEVPDGAEVARLRRGFQGQVLLPDQDGYHTARRVWNAMVDRRPAIIARCKSPADQGVTTRPSRTSVHRAHASPAAHRRAPGGRPPAVVPMVVGMHAPWLRSPSQVSSVTSECGRPASRDRYGCGHPDARQGRSASSAQT